MFEGESYEKEKVMKRRKFKLPHIYVLLIGIMVFCTILTWILPAGEFDRITNSEGIEVAVAGTYHRIESSPIGIFEMIQAIYKGMVEAAPVVFFVFVSFASIGLIIETGAFNGLVAFLLGVLKGNSRVIIIPIFLTLLGAGSSTIGVFEEIMPFIPIFVGITIAMGYDALVGLAIVSLGAGMGYSGAFMNPFTVGTAQTIAGVPLMSGSGYRIFSHLIMIIVASVYIIRYALKVQDDKTKSILYGEELQGLENGELNPQDYKFGIREKLVLLTLLLGIMTVVYGSSNYGWYFDEINAVFLIMGIVSSMIMGWGPSTIAEKVAKNFEASAVACMMIGIARGILVILTNGHIIDTIVYGLSLPLSSLPKLLMGPAMLAFQTVLNFFIPSGSGQAVTSMPIMAPLSDLLGISRQISVLAFQFGDGLSNILWPTAFAPMVAGLAGIKLEKWWKFFIPLFILLFITQSLLMMIAIAIGYN